MDEQIDYLNYPDDSRGVKTKHLRIAAKENIHPCIRLLLAAKLQAQIDDYWWMEKSEFKKFARPIDCWNNSLANKIFEEMKYYDFSREENINYIEKLSEEEIEEINEKKMWESLRVMKGRW